MGIQKGEECVNNTSGIEAGIIVQANKKKIEEAMTMCEALEELMQERLDVMMQEKMDVMMQEKLREVEENVKAEGEKIGRERVNKLTNQLVKAGRIKDIIRASEDEEFQEQLLKEFGV